MSLSLVGCGAGKWTWVKEMEVELCSPDRRSASSTSEAPSQLLGHGLYPSSQRLTVWGANVYETGSENQALKLCDIDHSRGIQIRDKSMWICFLGKAS